ncbi:hypothetical protein K502DRAFT_290027 [Neoconidiobolus thromboides FSU 785]|nr:hypothetical protein K502DRAFT_290027 [Neoconidiobolus thromboides FSU 785]
MGTSTSDSLLYESQNNMKMDELSSKVSQLHKVTLDIHGLVEEQNQALDESQTTFDSFGDRLKNTQHRVRNMLTSQNRRVMMYAIIIIFFLFIIIYHYFNRTSEKVEALSEPIEDFLQAPFS